MNVDNNGNNRKLVALAAMVALGVVVLALAGEAAKYVMPHDALYYFLVNKVYVLAAAIFLLLLGIDKINMGSVRNLIGLFVLVLLGLVVLWQLDRIASGVLWNGVYPSVAGRLEPRYETLLLQSLDVLGIVIGALGGFLVLLKGLDLAKDRLAGTGKTEKGNP